MHPYPDNRPALVLIAVVLALAGGGLVLHAESTSGPDDSPPAASTALEAGRALFTTHCSNCHGDAGDGNGPAAYLVHPKPRDLRTGIYRFRSTASGQLPLDEDLARTITTGLAGTPMPGYGGLLSDEEIGHLVTYAKSFSPRFEDPREARDVVTIGTAPPMTADRAARGAEVYRVLGCAECHGERGAGDGPSALLQLDERGFPTPPRNFAQGVFKNGARPEDLHRTILTGLNGTAMPAFGDLLDPATGLVTSEEAGWDLVAFVLSLGPESRRVASEAAGAEIPVARAAEEALFASAVAPGWSAIAAERVTLRPLWSRGDYPVMLAVRAATDGRRVAMLLEWEDATRSVASLGASEFPDKASVAFPLGSGIPFIGMGSRAADEAGQWQSLVNIWCWRADADFDRRAGGFADLGARYPLATVDWYPFRRGSLPGEAVTAADDRTTLHNPTFVTAWGAGNPVSDPIRPEREITEFDAAGFGTLTAQPPREQHVAGGGAWEAGRWRVLFVRDLYTGGDGDVIFEGRPRVPVSFAVWDGAFLERDGIKSVSNWHWLVFDSPQEAKR